MATKSIISSVCWLRQKLFTPLYQRSPATCLVYTWHSTSVMSFNQDYFYSINATQGYVNCDMQEVIFVCCGSCIPFKYLHTLKSCTQLGLLEISVLLIIICIQTGHHSILYLQCIALQVLQFPNGVVSEIFRKKLPPFHSN